jgi:hypothetical protein
MPSLLQGGPAPLFVAGSVQAKAAAKIQNLGYPGGAISAPVGVLDFFFDLSKIDKDYCQSPSVTVARRGYSRVRVIGKQAHTVSATSFSVRQFPFVDDQTGQAGKEMTIEDPATGDSWVLRRRGSMQKLILAICSGSLQASRSFYLRSSRGRTYGPFMPPGTTTTP